MSNFVNKNRSSSGFVPADQRAVATTTGTSRSDKSTMRLEQSGRNRQNEMLGDLKKTHPDTARYGNDLDAPPTPLGDYEIRNPAGSSGGGPRVICSDDGGGAASMVSHGGGITAMEGATVSERMSALARNFVEHFNSEGNRDGLYPPGIVSIKKEYEQINQEKASRGEMVHGLSFEPVVLDEENWGDLEERIETAREHISPDAIETTVKQAVGGFLKELAEERVGKDRAACLCRLMASRTEMSPDERWSVMDSVVKSSNKNNNKSVNIAFFDKIEKKVSDVFVNRANRFVFEDLKNDIYARDDALVFPPDILAVRSGATDWRRPLPSLFEPSLHLAVFAMTVEALARDHKPVTEIPGEKLKRELEAFVPKQVEFLVGECPHLFALQTINQRDDLTADEKLILALNVDRKIRTQLSLGASEMPPVQALGQGASTNITFSLDL